VDASQVDEGELVRRLAGEAWILLGPVPCSILLQLARPEIAAGVRDHSTFRARPMRRARHTVEFVYGLAFGSAEEAEAVSGRVRAVHRRVKGPGYSAEDPVLQTWVAATGLVTSGAAQMALVRAGRWDDAERALDRIERRFGAGAALPASLLEDRRPR
jgi:uncharacterized protein (DUF2236 family)